MDQVTPGGMLAVTYKWPENENYNLNTFLTINQEPQGISYLSWAQQFWFKNGDGGYMGIQTGGDLNGIETKIAIFSIWQALDVKKADLENSWAGPFGNEGTGLSCRIPYEWKQGVLYRISLSKIDTSRFVTSNWWGAYIQDISSMQKLNIGHILLPSGWGRLSSIDNFFVEYFMPIQSCENIPYTKATLNKPNRDNGKIQPLGLVKIEEYGKCSTNGKASLKSDGSITLETGLHKLQPNI